jgi:glycosyltransferase involved in cell wall biosynthesis
VRSGKPADVVLRFRNLAPAEPHAFRWRDLSHLQRCKDANKVMAYMGAALPAVIYPTEAEKLVVEDGVTGFFAHTVDEFQERMIALVRDKELRKRVGLAAHKEVWSKYSLRAQVEEIKRVIMELVSGPGA